MITTEQLIATRRTLLDRGIARGSEELSDGSVCLLQAYVLAGGRRLQEIVEELGFVDEPDYSAMDAFFWWHDQRATNEDIINRLDVAILAREAEDYLDSRVVAPH